MRERRSLSAHQAAKPRPQRWAGGPNRFAVLDQLVVDSQKSRRTKRQAETHRTPKPPQLMCITDESHSFTVQRPGRHGNCSLPAIYISDNPGLTDWAGHEPKIDMLVKWVIA